MLKKWYSCAMRTIIILIILSNVTIGAQLVNLDIICQIESGGNANAYNKHSKAVGLYQITPICLKEYNRFHQKKFITKDLYNTDVNLAVATWYLQKRIPQMLRCYGRDVNIENVLICYNAGISYVVSNRKLPKETVNYIGRYRKWILEK